MWYYTSTLFLYHMTSISPIYGNIGLIYSSLALRTTMCVMSLPSMPVVSLNIFVILQYLLIFGCEWYVHVMTINSDTAVSIMDVVDICNTRRLHTQITDDLVNSY